MKIYAAALITEALLSFYFALTALNLLRQCGLSRENYSKAQVLCPIGIAYIPAIIMSCFISMLVFKGALPADHLLFSFCAVCIAFSGLLDDLAGQKDIKGIRNHFKELLFGRLTTGTVKAAAGVFLSILSSISISYNLSILLLNAGLVLLSINALNLFDMRPGRCIKVFILSAFCLIALSINPFIEIIPFYYIIAATLAIMIFDLRERAMLGDTGANLIGFTLGFYSIRILPTSYKLILIALLFLLHLAAEKWSFSAIIERSRLLNYFDSLGRLRHEASQNDGSS